MDEPRAPCITRAMVAATCCAPTIALVQALGSEHTCPACGERFISAPGHAPSGAAATTPDNDDTELPRPASLRAALDALDLAHRWERESHASDVRGRSLSPLARMQSEADGSDRDARASEVTALMRLLTDARTDAGQRRQARFMSLLYQHCERAARVPDEDVDWSAARKLAARLGSLEGVHARVLRTLSARCTSQVSWGEAARIVADEHAPRALRAAWSLCAREVGRPGRPRRDRTQPAADDERLAVGHALITRALDAWEASSTSRPVET